MRLYSGSVSQLSDWCRPRYAEIARAVLTFLEDLRGNYRLVHQDITLRNILVDVKAADIAVSDYEMVEKIDKHPANKRDADYYWYYVGTGAEPDKPHRSWRQDLLMLGYALMDLTWPSRTPRSELTRV